MIKPIKILKKPTSSVGFDFISLHIFKDFFYIFFSSFTEFFYILYYLKLGKIMIKRFKTLLLYP
jgi:hypothetical protein